MKIKMDQQNKLKTTFNVILVTAIFSVVVSLLLLFNYMQLTSNDPIESKTLSALVEHLSDDPNNEELKAEIRAFDLLARKAYFTGRWQIETGGWLLLIGAIVLIVSLRYYFTLQSKIEEPDSNQISQQANRILSSKWLMGSGGLVMVLAITSAFFSIDHLENYEVPTVIADARDDSIEVVDLTTSAPVVTDTEEEIRIEKKVEPEAEIKQELAQTTPVLEKAAPSVPIQSSLNFPSTTEINQNYNGFRGAMGQGVSLAKNVPTSWDAASNKNILWKVKVPMKGYSSPVIWGDQLFVTGANPQERWIYCYNSNSGEIIWEQQANNITGSPATAPKTTDDTGLAAPSVATNGQFVIAVFGTGDIIAFDTKGKRLWAKNLGVPDNHYGHSSSPIIWKEHVVIQFDTNKGGRLLSLNIQSGEIIWDVKRSSRISWASPILAEIDGKIQVITSAEPTVAGYDITNGKELWKVDCMMGEVGPSPAFGNGLIFAANEYATLAAIDPVKGEIVWEDNYYLPEVASPVVSDGLLFIATTYGVFACFDVHTHNMYWEAEFNEGFYSSPIIVEGKIYATDVNGVVHIMKVDRELQQIASVPLGESITTTPAFTNNRMYIRGSENLYCIGEK